MHLLEIAKIAINAVGLVSFLIGISVFLKVKASKNAAKNAENLAVAACFMIAGIGIRFFGGLIFKF